MKVALKIWRYDAHKGERALKEYEFDAPEEATLLDCLDIVKDRLDGSLASRKSCRMMICGSCGMRMDGAAVLACKTRMYDLANAGHAPVISAMGNLDNLRRADYRVVVRVWFARDGRLERFELVDSSGSDEIDQNLKVAMSDLPRMRQSPPAEMPQPVKLRVTSRGAG